jgi:hypothetical protein
MKVNSIMQSWFKRKVMQKILFTACVLVGLMACVVQKPYVPMKSHDAVMTHDFPTKKSVFVKFGTPTSKETFENLENWYFKLSEVTNSNSIGFSSGTGKISQDPTNPLLPSENRSLITQQRQIISIRTNSTTRETYVKFWFVNDTVVKWETFGVDYSYPLPIAHVPGTPLTSVPKYANEFLFYYGDKNIYIYSHNAIRSGQTSQYWQNNGGINGPLNYNDVKMLIQNSVGFQPTFLPDINELKKIYNGNSKLCKILRKYSFTVWSSKTNLNGNVQCLNFKTGEIIEKSPQSLNYFVPLVQLAPPSITP